MLFLCILPMTGVVAVLLKQKIEKISGVCSICLTLFVYAFLKFNHGEIGIYMVFITAVASIPFLIYLCIKDFDSVCNYVFTYGGLALLFIDALLLVFDVGRQALYGPDPHYWVVQTKKLYLYDRLDVISGYIHPFLLQTIGYIGAKSWFRWSDGIILFAKDCFFVSVLTPLFLFAEVSEGGEEKCCQIFGGFIYYH